MTFPRALAIAELGWSTSKMDFTNFAERVKKQTDYFHKSGIAICEMIE